MLSVLQSQLEEGQMITSFTYRNLVPLYAEEEMRVCVRKERNEKNRRRYEVWIEGKAGGFAVRASATVGQGGVDSGII
jgi:hydroxyacyl-ACP dehydratase HTD2-like protein with hotdog domain